MQSIRARSFRSVGFRQSLAVVFLLGCVGGTALADVRLNAGPTPVAPLVDTRAGGVLADSYDYQRGGPSTGLISPAAGSYHYGFPVSTYRWGWFGAEHYYPTVLWHQGYYGDCCRWGYRFGY